MFKSLPIAKVRCPRGTLPSVCENYRRDTITLGWEDRVKIRSRRISDQGFEFATALERGTMLADGDVLVFNAEALIVEIRARLEPVFVVRPESPSEWARIAYHVGNSHQPLMLAADGLVCPDVPGMEQVLTYHAIAFSRELRAFTPIGQIPDHQHAMRA